MQAQLKCILEYESRSKYLFTRFPITGRILFIYAHKDFIDECNSQLKPIEHLGVVHKGRPQNMGWSWFKGKGFKTLQTSFHKLVFLVLLFQ